jgi:hypothetical protein
MRSSRRSPCFFRCSPAPEARQQRPRLLLRRPMPTSRPLRRRATSGRRASCASPRLPRPGATCASW